MKDEKRENGIAFEQTPDTGNNSDERKNSGKSGGGKALSNLYDMLHDLIYILAAVTLLFVFVVRLVAVDGDSMYPTLQHMDYLVLQSNFFYDDDDISNGDIVVLNVPYYWENERSLIVKRVIATEGQRIDIHDGKVYVDGECLEEDYINGAVTKERISGKPLEFPTVVPDGHIFVLGDNRGRSSDSRDAEKVGMVDERCVLGKVWTIVLPGETNDPLEGIYDPRDWGRIGMVS